MEKAIGLIIKEIIDEKRFKINALAESMGMSRQNIYQTFSRVDITDGDLNRWAKALGVTRTEILERAAKGDELHNNPSFGDEVLQAIKKMLEEELKEKNEQIRALQDALKQQQQITTVLLGKSPEYSNQTVMPQFQYGFGNPGFGSAAVA